MTTFDEFLKETGRFPTDQEYRFLENFIQKSKVSKIYGREGHKNWDKNKQNH